MNGKAALVIFAILLIAVTTPASAAVTNHQIIRQDGWSNSVGQGIGGGSIYVTQKAFQSGDHNYIKQCNCYGSYSKQVVRQNGKSNSAGQWNTMSNSFQRVIQTGTENSATQVISG